MERFLRRSRDRVAFDHGIEQKDVGVLELTKDEVGIRHFVEGATDRDEMGEEKVRLVEVMAEEVGVDLGQFSSGVMAMEEAKDSPLRLPATSAHPPATK